MGLISISPVPPSGSGQFRPPLKPVGGFLKVALRIALSAFFSLALVSLSLAGLFVTSAPEFISLLVEPFSLLLLPGVLLSIIPTGDHRDYPPDAAAYASLLFYFIVFYTALWLRERYKRRRLSRQEQSR